MRKSIFTLLTLVSLLLLSSDGSARIWRVNNITGITADFTDVFQAIQSASVIAGDTIQVEGSPTGYNATTVSKRLVFIGTGYLLANNPQTQANPNSSKLSGLNFSTGSEGSIVMGMDNLSVIIGASNITVSRNNVSQGLVGNGQAISIDSIKFIQNYNANIQSFAGGTYSHVIIENNICNSVSMVVTASGIFGNNVALSAPTLSNFLVENNIIRGDTTQIAASNVFKNNILHNGPNGTGSNGNGNFYVDDFNTLFVNWTHFISGGTLATDGDLMLSSGSLAKGNGVGGGDLGAFGGGVPYILSGMPPVPSIYALTAPNTVSASSTTMPVTISIQSHN